MFAACRGGVGVVVSLSVLSNTVDSATRRETREAPDFFGDLNLDQIVGAITAGQEEYDLMPFFYIALHDINTIVYRHEVMRDLENQVTLKYIKSFNERMRSVRMHLTQADKSYYTYQREAWFLDAVEIYCDGVDCLSQDLNSSGIASRALAAFRDFLKGYTESAPFQTVHREAKQLKADLSTVQYCVLINGRSVKVRNYDSEVDYSAEVITTFKKFQQGAAKDYRLKFDDCEEMNHVEAQILSCVALLYPQIFSRLDDFCARNGAFADETISVFDREIQFYIAYLEYIRTLKRKGLSFCYPKVSDSSKEIYSRDGFDAALATKLLTDKAPVVCNDFHLDGMERIIVVSGPNQGGKTTFSRFFGQLHYLASLGLPVPGSEARLFLFDRLFTHFENEENIKNLRGRLHDDLVRIRDILHQATASSIIIMNEIFTSTALDDAIFLGKQVIQEILELDSLCVYVTFIEELSTISRKTVSMVSTVVPEDPTVRTFKVLRRPSDGLAYAQSIAEKYRLTYERVKERIRL
jgi:DNA mismatch repair protein MutS